MGIYRNKYRDTVTGEVRENPTWMMVFYRRGKAVRLSTGTTNEREARAKLRDAETDTSRGAPVIGVGTMTFMQSVADVRADYALNDRRSLHTVNQRLDRHLVPYFGEMLMVDITAPVIRAYQMHRKSEPKVHARTRAKALANKAQARKADGRPALKTYGKYANATINRETDILNRMFTLGKEAGLIAAVPAINSLKEAGARQGFFEDAEFDRVLAQIKEPVVRQILTVAKVTGWRAADELFPMEWTQVDMPHREFRLYDSKTMEPRVFKMTTALYEIFQARLALTEQLRDQGTICTLVFFWVRNTKRGGAAKDSPKRYKPIKKIWNGFLAACKRACVPKKHIHDLRRTAIRNMDRLGIVPSVGMKLAGHKTRQMYDRYNITSEADLTDAAAKLEGLNLPEAATGTNGVPGTKAHRPTFGAKRGRT